ncbi:MAG: DNA-directed RNA polymerase subunit alpha C-terminal domain-containing protein [Planctomycetota bacterium]
MSDPATIEKQAASESSIRDLVRQDQRSLSHLLEVRRLAFSDQGNYETLKVLALEEVGLRQGICKWILGRYEEAEAVLLEFQNEPGVRALRAMTATGLGKPERALEIVPDPSTSEEMQARVQALSRIYHSDQKARDELGALAKSPGLLEGTSWVPFLHGLEAEHGLRNDQAIAHYVQAHEMDATNVDCSFRLARLLDLKGNDEEAIELYEDILSRSSANTSVLGNLGILYEDQESWRRAERCFQSILLANPTDKRALLFLDDVEASMHMLYDEDLEKREDKRNAILRTPVTDFELSVRSRNCLAKMGIRTLGDLVRKTEAELLSYKNFGETSLMEIQEILNSKNLRLGMDHDELLSDSVGQQRTPVNVDMSDPRNRPIAELDLSVRSRRVIEMFKLRTIGDLAMKTEAELMACPNFGQTSLNEIKSKLDGFGLSLKG